MDTLERAEWPEWARLAVCAGRRLAWIDNDVTALASCDPGELRRVRLELLLDSVASYKRWHSQARREWRAAKRARCGE